MAFEGGPKKEKGRARVFGEFAAFLTFVIGVEDESKFVEALEQDDAGGREAVFGGGGQGHGGGFGDVGGQGALEPMAELLKRIGVQVRLEKWTAGIL